jgi:hypothetical protein
MNPDTAMATGLFVLPMIVMVLFLAVWCRNGWIESRDIRFAPDGTGRGLFEFERNARGLGLLKNWLSPAQLLSYEEHGYFDVTGAHSGRIYRIHHGAQANVEQLDEAGRPVCAWCFGPEGNLVPGDVMLAQKIALEADERAALAVAVRHLTLHIGGTRPLRWIARAY